MEHAEQQRIMSHRGSGTSTKRRNCKNHYSGQRDASDREERSRGHRQMRRNGPLYRIARNSKVHPADQGRGGIGPRTHKLKTTSRRPREEGMEPRAHKLKSTSRRPGEGTLDQKVSIKNNLKPISLQIASDVPQARQDRACLARHRRCKQPAVGRRSCGRHRQRDNRTGTRRQTQETAAE